MKDPIVIEPAGFSTEAAWKGCSDYVERCGGLVDEDGEYNMRAAFGADPGCCTCPNCGEYFWQWGTLIECTECHFRFPPDWWPRYSEGVSDRKTVSGERKIRDEQARQRWISSINEKLEKSMRHPYYRYGYEHPVESAWETHDKLPWKEIMEAAK